jgi:hypothetical protein
MITYVSEGSVVGAELRDYSLLSMRSLASPLPILSLSFPIYEMGKLLMKLCLGVLWGPSDVTALPSPTAASMPTTIICQYP